MGYVNKESCLATGIALAVLAILAVSARLTQRVRANRQRSQIHFTHHLDDLFCLLALVPTIGTAVVLIYGKESRTGRKSSCRKEVERRNTPPLLRQIFSRLTRSFRPGAHVNVLGQHNDASNAENWITTTTPQLVLLEKASRQQILPTPFFLSRSSTNTPARRRHQFVYIIFVLQPLAIGFIKLSFLFFYQRVFFVYESFRLVSWILIAVTAAWITAFFFGFTFACGTSFETNWASLAEIGEKCGFGFMATVVFAILDAVLDFIILVLPLPWVSYGR